MRSYSVTQKNITLSSAEAELIALVRCTSEAIGISQLAQGWGISLEAQIFVDSSAALSIATRRGVGKLRHVRIGHLWVQERAAEGDVHFSKVKGTENPADLCTKFLSPRVFESLFWRLGQVPTWAFSSR